MSDIVFECKKCGTCCRGLFVHEKNGVLSGLPLTKEEAKLFDPKSVVPYYAIGDKKRKTVILFQLVLSDCPHLNDKNECNIYEKRPLICKVFPYQPSLFQAILLPKCPQIGKFGGKAGEMCPVIIDDATIDKAREETKIMFLTIEKEAEEKGLKTWFFDLATRKWVASGAIDWSNFQLFLTFTKTRGSFEP